MKFKMPKFQSLVATPKQQELLDQIREKTDKINSKIEYTKFNQNKLLSEQRAHYKQSSNDFFYLHTINTYLGHVYDLVECGFTNIDYLHQTANDLTQNDYQVVE